MDSLKKDDLAISESIHGTWYYHWSPKESPHTALCGAKTMVSHAPASSWGDVGHLKEGYCSACASLYEGAS